MKFYSILPEVPGTAGNRSVCNDWNARPLQLEKVHYELEMFPEDAIICTNGAYLVTRELAESFRMAKLKGFEIHSAEVTTGEKFAQWHGSPETETYLEKVQIPDFVWLKVVGSPGIDDFGLIESQDLDPLIISEKALAILRTFQVQDCEVAEVKSFPGLATAS